MPTRLKYPEYAARGERCPWCKNLKRGRCSGCGQLYGVPAPSDKLDAILAHPEAIKEAERQLADAADVTWSASGKDTKVIAVVTPSGIYVPPREPVVLTLDEPPSANRWWRRHGTTMHLSREAREYKAAVLERVRAILPPPIAFDQVAFPDEPLTVVIVWRRERKSGDLDKRLGVLLDALQGSVYANDAQIVQIWARRCDEHPDLAPGTVRVEVSPT